MPFSSNSSSNRESRKLPEVAERETISNGPRDLQLSIDHQGNIESLDRYQVFLKKNLKWQAPPADLLANIHARIDRIKAEEAKAK